MSESLTCLDLVNGDFTNICDKCRHFKERLTGLAGRRPNRKSPLCEKIWKKSNLTHKHKYKQILYKKFNATIEIERQEKLVNQPTMIANHGKLVTRSRANSSRRGVKPSSHPSEMLPPTPSPPFYNEMKSNSISKESSPTPRPRQDTQRQTPIITAAPNHHKARTFSPLLHHDTQAPTPIITAPPNPSVITIESPPKAYTPTPFPSHHNNSDKLKFLFEAIGHVEPIDLASFVTPTPCPTNITLKTLQSNDPPSTPCTTNTPSRIPASTIPTTTPVDDSDNRLVTVDKSVFSRYKNSHKKLRKLNRILKRKKYKRSGRIDSLLGLAVSTNPKASFLDWQTTIPIVESYILAKLGMSCDASYCLSNPCRNLIKKMIARKTSRSIIEDLSSLDDTVYVYITLDKGHDGGTSTLPKCICWYDKILDEVRSMLIDVDTSLDSSNEVAKAVKNSLIKLTEMFPGKKFVLGGSCTDSGGGGTLTSLERELKKELVGTPNITFSPTYRVGSCCLHNIQTSFRNVVEATFGEGGLKDDESKATAGNVNAMQLMHGLYNVRNHVSTKLLKKMWQFTTSRLGIDAPYHALQAPILTQWWSVGECAKSVANHWRVWKALLPKILRLPSTYVKAAARKIIKSTMDLMEVKEIRSDIILLKIYHQIYINKFMVHLQRGEKLVNYVPGFQSRLIGTTYFLMCKTISDVSGEKWKINNDFKSLVDFNENNLNAEEIEAVNKKVKLTLSISLKSLHKHFDQWWNEHFVTNLFGEPQTASVVARFIENLPPPPHTSNFTSPHFSCEINLREYYKFIKKRCKNKLTIINSPQFIILRPYVIRLSSGENLLADIDSPTNNFLKFYLNYFSPLPTNTHEIERYVKLAKYCGSVGNRSEEVRTLYAISQASNSKKNE